MVKLKIKRLTGLSIGGVIVVFWLYFNIGSAIYEEGIGSKLYHILLALIFLAPYLLVWKWPKLAGWYFIVMGIVLGGGYFYLILFRSPDSMVWWAALLVFALLGLLPMLAGFLLVKSILPKEDEKK
ncbi:hypothetical protein KKI23_01970 [Patescibacteria group bacterium]|nr:hypothetical protein [Patescibacteria group bacterium]